MGDLNGDGVADIIAGQSTGGSGVRVFAGGSLPTAGAPELLYKTKLKGSDGVYVSAANVTGDAKLELLLGSSDRSPARLAVYSPDSRTPLYQTSVGAPGSKGLRIAAVDVDLDGIAEIMAAPGGKEAGQLQLLDGDDGRPLPEYSFAPFPSAAGLGIYDAGSVT